MKIELLEQAADDLLAGARFPYAVYYRVQETLIRVYAVLDCRRSPDKMRTRLLSSD